MKDQNQNQGFHPNLYRALVENVKDYALILLDARGNISLWNKGAEKCYGFSAGEITGNHFSCLFPEKEVREGLPDAGLRKTREQGHFEAEGWQWKNDGSRFWACVAISSFYTNNGELEGYTVVTTDLTRMKETEERIKKREERYRMIVEGIKDYAIFMMDPEGNIMSWNEGAKRLKGYTEEEILGKNFSIFYPREAVDSGYPAYELKEAITHGRFEDEGLRVRKDGSLFYANVVITPLYDANEELIGFSKVTRDLTERKKAEEKVLLMNTELEERVQKRTEELTHTVSELKKINADLDNFIYTASHDLKAPVSNIEGLINTLGDILTENQLTNEEVSEILEMIRKSITRFQQTIRDLTAVNQSQRDDRMDIIDINLRDIISDILESISHLIREAKAEITVDVNMLQPFFFSKIHIRSIIYNLLTNAIKYRSPDRPLHIRISGHSSNGECIIEVKDNGLGIKEENKEKVFHMFKRLHDHVEGSGIGLYIVRRIVDTAGGRVEIESQEGAGTTFKVFLPVATGLHEA